MTHILARQLRAGQEFIKPHPHYLVYRVAHVELSRNNQGGSSQTKARTLEETEESWRTFNFKLRRDIQKKTRVRVYVEGRVRPLLYDYGDRVQLYGDTQNA
jgi:hypothetical protein